MMDTRFAVTGKQLFHRGNAVTIKAAEIRNDQPYVEVDPHDGEVVDVLRRHIQQCMNQQCDYYGKLLCNSCVVEVPQMAERTSKVLVQEGKTVHVVPCLALLGILVIVAFIWAAYVPRPDAPNPWWVDGSFGLTVA